MAEEPDPELRPILEVVSQTPNLEDVGVQVAREQYEALSRFTADYADDLHEQSDRTVPGAAGELDARVYRPGAGDRPVLVYFHGGGFVVGSLDTHDNVCQKLAIESGWTVVSVAYRLAPEHPFPAALEDAYAAVEWVDENPDAVDGDGTLAVGGDSAGANLSAGVTLMARDADAEADPTAEGGPRIAHQLLYYPSCGAPFQAFESRETYTEGYFLERDTLEWFFEQYVQSRAHVRNEYLAPLLVSDLSGLPPATVITAGFDPLCDEGDAYAEALRDDGIDVEHARFDAMVHGFASFLGMVSAADESIGIAADRLRGVCDPAVD